MPRTEVNFWRCVANARLAVKNHPAQLAVYQREFDELISIYFDPITNVLRKHYLLTRATKN